MKTFIFIVAILSLTTVCFGFCQTDYNCQSDCLNKGYQWGYCNSLCSWCND